MKGFSNNTLFNTQYFNTSFFSFSNQCLDISLLVLVLYLSIFCIQHLENVL